MAVVFEQLTDAQRAVVKMLIELSNPTTVITGGPGTGKTVCLRVAIEKILENGKEQIVCVSRVAGADFLIFPAHRVRQLGPSWQQALSWSMPVGDGDKILRCFPIQTATQALRTPRFASAEIAEVLKCVSPATEGKVIFVIDEAMQLCTQTFKDFVDALDNVYGHRLYTAAHCRLWVVGDPFQLQPVGGHFFMRSTSLMEHPLFCGPETAKQPISLGMLSEQMRSTDERVAEFVDRLGRNGDPFDPCVQDLVLRAKRHWESCEDKYSTMNLFTRLFAREESNRERAIVFAPHATMFSTVSPPGTNPDQSPYTSASLWVNPRDDGYKCVVEFVEACQARVKRRNGTKSVWQVAKRVGTDTPYKFTRRTTVKLVNIVVPKKSEYAVKNDDGSWTLMAPPVEKGSRYMLVPTKHMAYVEFEAVAPVDLGDPEEEIGLFRVPLFVEPGRGAYKRGAMPVVSIRACGWERPGGELVGETRLGVNVQGQSLDKFALGKDVFGASMLLMLFTRGTSAEACMISPGATFKLDDGSQQALRTMEQLKTFAAIKPAIAERRPYARPVRKNGPGNIITFGDSKKRVETFEVNMFSLDEIFENIGKPKVSATTKKRGEPATVGLVSDHVESNMFSLENIFTTPSKPLQPRQSAATKRDAQRSEPAVARKKLCNTESADWQSESNMFCLDNMFSI